MPVYDPAKAKQLLAEAGHPDGFDAGEYYCDASYSNVAEAVLDNLRRSASAANCGRSSGPPSSRPIPTRSSRTCILGGSGAFGNAATRLEAFVVKGGTYAYGSYPDIDALFQQQAAELDHKKRAAMLRQDAAARRRADDLCADLAARLHQRRRAAGRRSRASA